LTGAESPIFHLGGELAFTVSSIELGGFFDRHIVKGSGSNADGGVNFYGGLVRFVTPGMGIFLDGRVGLTKYSSQSSDSDNALAYGFGIGSRFEIAKTFQVMPRLGYTILPAEVTTSGTLPFTTQTTDTTGTIFEIGLLLRIVI